MAGIGGLLLGALGAAPGAYQKSRANQMALDTGQNDQLATVALGNALALMQPGGGGMTGGMTAGLSGASIPPPGGGGQGGAQPPPPGVSSQPMRPPGPPQAPPGPPQGPMGPPPPGSMRPGGPPGMPPQMMPPPGPPPQGPPPGMVNPRSVGGQPQNLTGPVMPPGGFGPPGGQPPRPQPPAPQPGGPQMGGAPGASPGPIGAGGSGGMPQMGGAGQMDMGQLVQLIKRANPQGVPPQVLMQAVQKGMTLLKPDQQLYARELMLQYKEQQLNARLDATLGARATEGAANRGSREGIAGAQIQSRQDLARMTDDRIRELAEGNNEVKMALELAREKAAQERTETQQAGANQRTQANIEGRATQGEENRGAAQLRTETVTGARAAEGAANRGAAQTRTETQQAGALERTREQQAGAEKRTGMQQEGAGQRQTERLASQLQRLNVSIDGKQKLGQMNAEAKRELQEYLEAGREMRSARTEGGREARAEMSDNLKRELQKLNAADRQKLEEFKQGEADVREKQRLQSREDTAAKGQEAATERTKIQGENAMARTIVQQAGAKDRAELVAKAKMATGQQVPPDQIEKIAEAIANYQQRPYSGTAARSNVGAAVMSRVYELNKDYKETLYNARNSAEKAFSSGSQSDTIRSLHVANAHVNTMLELFEKMNNGDVPAANAIKNEYRRQTGKVAATAFDAAKQIIAAEIIKSVAGRSGGGVKERLEMAENIKSASSPAQMKGTTEAVKGLMQGQLDGFRQQYKAAGLGDDFDIRFGFEDKPFAPVETPKAKPLPPGWSVSPAGML